MKALIVGLTGQSGAGKSFISALIASGELNNDIKIIDCDKTTHEVIEQSPCFDKLLEHFGDRILDQNSKLSRKAIASIVFSDKNELEMLNRITHPFILEKIVNEISIYNKNFSVIILDAPTLFESGANKLCDRTIAVVCDHDILIKRIIQRDNITLEAAKKRIESQHDESFFRKKCDFVITNNEGLADLNRQILEIIKKLKVE